MLVSFFPSPLFSLFLMYKHVVIFPDVIPIVPFLNSPIVHECYVTPSNLSLPLSLPPLLSLFTRDRLVESREGERFRPKARVKVIKLPRYAENRRACLPAIFLSVRQWKRNTATSHHSIT